MHQPKRSIGIIVYYWLIINALLSVYFLSRFCFLATPQILTGHLWTGEFWYATSAAAYTAVWDATIRKCGICRTHLGRPPNCRLVHSHFYISVFKVYGSRASPPESDSETFKEHVVMTFLSHLIYRWFRYYTTMVLMQYGSTHFWILHL